MPMRWSYEPLSQEPSPEERAIEAEERERTSERGLSEEEERILKSIWSRMRRVERALYVVFKRWNDDMDFREERNPRNPGIPYRGWYAEVGRELGLTANAVKWRLKSGQKWFARQIEIHMGRPIPR